MPASQTKQHQQHQRHNNNRNKHNNTPWPFWLNVAHAQIEKCSEVLMDRQFGKSAPAVSYAAPAPVDEYIATASAVYAALPPVVEYCSPAPAVFAAPAPVVENMSPAPAVAPAASYVAPEPDEEHVAPAKPYVAPAPVFKCNAPGLSLAAPAPVVEHLAPDHAVSCSAPDPVVFPLSLDGSDMSSPEEMYTRSGESLPVPTKTFTPVDSASRPCSIE